MTEVQFARTFLSALDARPIKLTADSIADQRQLPASIGYTLPKYPSSPVKRKRTADSSSTTASPSSAATSASATGPGVAVTLSYPKSSAHSLALAGQPRLRSVFELKSAYAAAFGVPVDKIKLLHAKRPVADSKTLADVLGGSMSSSGGDNGGLAATVGEAVEFSVMLLGGAVPSASKPEAVAAPVSADVQEATRIPIGKELETEEFWVDLKGFLIQRLKDEKEGERLAKLFRSTAR